MWLAAALAFGAPALLSLTTTHLLDMCIWPCDDACMPACTDSPANTTTHAPVLAWLPQGLGPDGGFVVQCTN